MTATLRFSLPDDREEWEAAQQGMSLRLVVTDFDNWLRGEVKYKEHTEEREEVLEEVRDKLHEMLSEEGIALW
jgi:hypothetical protein